MDTTQEVDLSARDVDGHQQTAWPPDPVMNSALLCVWIVPNAILGRALRTTEPGISGQEPSPSVGVLRQAPKPLFKRPQTSA